MAIVMKGRYAQGDDGLRTIKLNTRGQLELSTSISDTSTLVTEEDLTASYADLGDEILTEGYSKIGVWIEADVNDSETVTLKVLGLHETSGIEFDIDGISVKTLWTTSAVDFNEYYEYTIGAIPIIKLQAKAETVGSTAGDLTINITKSN
jgi:hypothetical protein